MNRIINLGALAIWVFVAFYEALHLMGWPNIPTFKYAPLIAYCCLAWDLLMGIFNDKS